MLTVKTVLRLSIGPVCIREAGSKNYVYVGLGKDLSEDYKNRCVYYCEPIMYNDGLATEVTVMSS